MNNGGDVLARGQRRATFPPAQTTREKYDAAFVDFDPEAYRKKCAEEDAARDKELTERENAQG